MGTISAEHHQVFAPVRPAIGHGDSVVEGHSIRSSRSVRTGHRHVGELACARRAGSYSRAGEAGPWRGQ